MIRVSGREYTGLLKTACFQKGEMSCLSCHSVHDSSPNFQVSRGMESNAACLQCHQSFAAKLEEHTHHPANSAGSLCYNCHMPYTSYGLLKGIRAHQISSPTIKASLQTGRPDACNLCHLDKTLDWAGQKLTAWYKQPREELSVKEKSVAASVLWATQGDAGQRGLIAWHMGWEPARQISGENWLPPYLATLMQDDYPAVRCIAGRSLKSLRGFERVPYDYVAEDKLRDAAKLVFAQWQKLTKPKENPSLLLGKNGDLQDEQLRELLAGQNHRVVNLNE
jgi:predicted CXXCH cytochrome family protein